MEWAARQIAAHGRSRVRLDCMGENSQLCRYYENELGFTSVGVREGAGWTAKLFEKEIDSNVTQSE